MKISGKLLRTLSGPRYVVEGWLYRPFCNKQPLEELRNKFAGKPMLVVGNGPSLNDTPLDEFASVPSLGMNKINMLFDRTTWRPSAIVTCNTLVVQQNIDYFDQSDIPCFLSWKTRWFIPSNKKKNINFFYEYSGNKFSTDLIQGCGQGETVTYACMQFAYFMGANPVILFGVDHSFKTEGSANTIEVRKGEDVNHFDPNYFAAGQRWGIPNLDGSELAFQQARQAFEKDGRTIYDATIGGKLQIFPKITLDEAREHCNLI